MEAPAVDVLIICADLAAVDTITKYLKGGPAPEGSIERCNKTVFKVHAHRAAPGDTRATMDGVLRLHERYGAVRTIVVLPGFTEADLGKRRLQLPQNMFLVNSADEFQDVFGDPDFFQQLREAPSPQKHRFLALFPPTEEQQQPQEQQPSVRRSTVIQLPDSVDPDTALAIQAALDDFSRQDGVPAPIISHHHHEAPPSREEGDQWPVDASQDDIWNAIARDQQRQRQQQQQPPPVSSYNQQQFMSALAEARNTEWRGAVSSVFSSGIPSSVVVFHNHGGGSNPPPPPVTDMSEVQERVTASNKREFIQAKAKAARDAYQKGLRDSPHMTPEEHRAAVDAAVAASRLSNQEEQQFVITPGPIQYGPRGIVAPLAPAPAPVPRPSSGATRANAVNNRIRQRHEQTQASRTLRQAVAAPEAQGMLQRREEPEGIMAMPTSTEDNTCDICKVHQITTMLIPCTHYLYCNSCIEQWRKIENSCPLCKVSITSLVQPRGRRNVHAQFNDMKRATYVDELAAEFEQEAKDLREKANELRDDPPTPILGSPPAASAAVALPPVPGARPIPTPAPPPPKSGATKRSQAAKRVEANSNRPAPPPAASDSIVQRATDAGVPDWAVCLIDEEDLRLMEEEDDDEEDLLMQEDDPPSSQDEEEEESAPPPSSSRKKRAAAAPKKKASATKKKKAPAKKKSKK